MNPNSKLVVKDTYFLTETYELRFDLLKFLILQGRFAGLWSCTFKL